MARIGTSELPDVSRKAGKLPENCAFLHTIQAKEDYLDGIKSKQMNEKIQPKVQAYFWIIGIAALIWNAMGVFAYLGNVFMSEEAFAQMTEAEQRLMEEIPAWATGAFAIAVFAGLLGALGLLLRKKWAAPVFGLSLIAILIQQVYNHLIAKMYTVTGSGSLVFALMIVVIGVILYLLARSWSRKGWFR